MNYRMIYRLCLGLGFIACALGVRAQQALYDESRITRIELTFSISNWDAVLDNYKANDLDERLLGSCTVNGVFFDSVGVKYKGNSTYSPTNDKNPLNIQLDYRLDQHYRGYETIKLSNGKKDPSFVREVLSYSIVRKYMEAPLSNFAEVYINGDYYGLFSSSESINGDFGERHLFSEGYRPRFKCNPESNFDGNGSSLEYFGTDSNDYLSSYELKTTEGWEELIGLANALNQGEKVSEHIDIDQSLWMLAFNNVVVNLDSYTGPFRQNYYLIYDHNDRFIPIIWDLNESFGGFEQLYRGQSGHTEDLFIMDPFIREDDETWPLIHYLFANEQYKRMYMAHCRTMIKDNFENGWYLERAQELQALIRESVEDDPNAFYDVEQFDANLEETAGSGRDWAVGIKELMDERLAFYQQHPYYLAAPPEIGERTYEPSNVSVGEDLLITATVSDADQAWIMFRSSATEPYRQQEMYDDGTNGDQEAGDGIFSTSLTAGYNKLQYYLYAENDSAGVFSPENASKAYHEIILDKGLVLNEVVSHNESTAFDEDFRYEDWIELYNRSNEVVELKGYYLSNHPDTPLMWPLPYISVDPDSYTIVWADKDTDDEILHCTFKLPAKGSTLYLNHVDQGLIDEVTIPYLDEDIAYARYENGTGDFIKMEPSYKAYNDQPIGFNPFQDDQTGLSVFPNPFHHQFQVHTTSPTADQLDIFDLQGRRMHSTQFNQSHTVDASLWPSGLYLIRLHTGETRKIYKTK